MNESKPLAFAVVGAMLAVAVAVFWWTNMSGLRGPLTKSFYSDDDGKSYFVDNVANVPPFQRNGKEAVQAFVYRAGSNPPFIGYLLKYKPETAKKIQELVAKPQTGEVANELLSLRGSALVKRPGDPSWKPVDSGAGGEIVTIKAPAGQTGELQSVEP